ncbi:MAG: CapA family protein [Butyrivibrio sp.]|nr:CapA family protein [Butyrivibrio sp.]
MRRRKAILILLICVLCGGGCGVQDVISCMEAELPEESVAGDSSADEASIDTQDDSAVAASSEEELSQSSSDVSLIMVGDILLHEQIEDVAQDADGNYNFDFIFENMKPEIEAADIAMVNQEVIIGGEELGISGYPEFNAPYEAGDALVAAGFDIVCSATNHALDKGKKGILNCREFWKQNYPQMKVVGLNDTEDDYENIDIIEKNGIKIAVLNYTYGTNGIPLPSDMPHIVDVLDEDKVIKDIAYAEENADFTIVCPHWGTEYNLDIDKDQKKWTEIFRENGVDLVIGAHPHVIEPIKMLEDENEGITNNHGDGDMLVYYSIGNFVSWTSSSGKGVADRSVGGMAKITITKTPEGEVVVKDHSVKALVCHNRSEEHGVTVYPLSEYSEDLANENEIREKDSSFSKQYCTDLCNKVWGESWE